MKLKKQMGLYEIENIDNANICTIAVNPKEYFEKLKNRLINKKHKGVRRDTPGMNFESYAERINVLKEIGSENFMVELLLCRSVIQHYLLYEILKSLIQKFTLLLREKKKGY